MEAAKHDVERKTLDQRHQMSDLERLRHSCAHVLATAVLRLWPDAKLDIGPPTAEGFYYDFMVAEPFTTEDLETIEQQMNALIARDLPFIYREYSRDVVLHMNSDEPMKLEIINEIPEGESITTYSHDSTFWIHKSGHHGRW